MENENLEENASDVSESDKNNQVLLEDTETEINSNEGEVENTKNLSFTVIGQYVAIIDFVSSIEDDSELAFRIENFNLLPDGTNLKATFDITGIRIKIENTTQSVSGTNNETAAEGTATPDGATNTEATTTGTSSANTIDTNTTTQGS